MELSKEARRILEVLADESENNPSSRLNGIDALKLGAPSSQTKVRELSSKAPSSWSVWIARRELSANSPGQQPSCRQFLHKPCPGSQNK